MNSKVAWGDSLGWGGLTFTLGMPNVRTKTDSLIGGAVFTRRGPAMGKQEGESSSQRCGWRWDGWDYENAASKKGDFLTQHGVSFANYVSLAE